MRPGWKVTPAPDGRGARPGRPAPRRTASRWWIAAVVVGPAGAQPVDLLAGAAAQRLGADPLQPDLPDRRSRTGTSRRSRRPATGHLRDVQTAGPLPGERLRASSRRPISPPRCRRLPTTRRCWTCWRAMASSIDAKAPNSGPSFLTSLIFGFGPTLVLILLFVLIARRAAGGAGGAGGLMSFGRSRARRVEASEQPVTFEDVAGIDEAKEELTEIVDFLKNPDKYLLLGARIPRGVLLSGPPGTGKTLLARAVAGEAGVPFFQMSASEFVEMIVGVGASRVRDLFAQAKTAAPSIIFIDELDAIGRSRSGGGPNLSGGHDEREQTLNQILTEMDGFDPRTSVIVLGATNRPEVLDPALLRPGRFDRRVAVSPSGPRGARGDPARPQPVGAPGRPHRPRRDRLRDPRHGRRRSGQPGQRSGAAGRAPRSRQGHPRGLQRRHGADRPRGRAQGDDDRRRSPAHRLSRVRPRDRRDGHPGGRPGPQGVDHPPRPGSRRHLLGPRRRSLQSSTSATCCRRSRWRSAAAWPRRSCSAT